MNQCGFDRTCQYSSSVSGVICVHWTSAHSQMNVNGMLGQSLLLRHRLDPFVRLTEQRVVLCDPLLRHTIRQHRHLPTIGMPGCAFHVRERAKPDLTRAGTGAL